MTLLQIGRRSIQKVLSAHFRRFSPSHSRPVRDFPDPGDNDESALAHLLELKTPVNGLDSVPGRIGIRCDIQLSCHGQSPPRHFDLRFP